MTVLRRLKLQSTRLFAALVYIVVIAAAIVIADYRAPSVVAEIQTNSGRDTQVETKPFFSLSSNRTFATSENPRLWVDHRGIESLDFRVYRVNDPTRFFAQLSNPHQMGEDEREQVALKITPKPSLLERVRTIKIWAYAGIKNYFRDQLKQ